MKGLDCGTGNYVAATADAIKTQGNAFLTIDKANNDNVELESLLDRLAEEKCKKEAELKRVAKEKEHFYFVRSKKDHRKCKII